MTTENVPLIFFSLLFFVVVGSGMEKKSRPGVRDKLPDP
jgi:hypothetical protein